MIIALVIILVSIIILYLWRHFTFWSRQGVPSEKFISWKDFFLFQYKLFLEKDEKYGKIIGFYTLNQKILTINEPELIREVFLKNIQAFPHHQMFHLSESPKVNKMLFFMPGDEHWKRVRNITTPAFTSGKLKAMMSHISDISDNLVKNIEEYEKRGEVVDMRKYIGAFAMDVISACAYGIKIDSISNPDHPIVQNAKKFFGANVNISQMVSVLFPKLGKVLKLEFFDKKAVKYFDELTNQIVSERKKINKLSNEEKGKKRTDFIQLMMDSEKSAKDLGYDSNSEDENDVNNEEKPIGTLTPDELTAQGILFFIAGYDTTSAALSHLVYFLSQNKDCQQILYEELKDVKEFSYEKLSQLKYLNAVIDETLRLAPSLILVQRQSDHDFVLSNGIKVPAGTCVEFSPYVVHRDPKYWQDPLEFKPERFFEKPKHPCAYLPFGTGHRLCVGQRFALNEMRMCAAKLFHKFEFSLTPDSKLEYFRGHILFSPKNVLVSVKARN